MYHHDAAYHSREHFQTYGSPVERNYHPSDAAPQPLFSERDYQGGYPRLHNGYEIRKHHPRETYHHRDPVSYSSENHYSASLRPFRDHVQQRQSAHYVQPLRQEKHLVDEGYHDRGREEDRLFQLRLSREYGCRPEYQDNSYHDGRYQENDFSPHYIFPRDRNTPERFFEERFDVLSKGYEHHLKDDSSDSGVSCEQPMSQDLSPLSWLRRSEEREYVAPVMVDKSIGTEQPVAGGSKELSPSMSRLLEKARDYTKNQMLEIRNLREERDQSRTECERYKESHVKALEDIERLKKQISDFQARERETPVSQHSSISRVDQAINTDPFSASDIGQKPAKGTVEYEIKKAKYHNTQQGREIRKLKRELKNVNKTSNRHEQRRIELVEEVKQLRGRLTNSEAKVKLLTTGEGIWPGLKIDKSEIPGADDGLFSTESIPQGVVIGKYYGERVYRQEVDEDLHAVWKTNSDEDREYLYDDTYVVWIKHQVKEDGEWIKQDIEKGVDGDRPGENPEKTILRKMNHSEKNNMAHFVCEDGSVMFHTIRPVKRGDELLWDYDEEVETDFTNGVKKRIVQKPEEYFYMNGEKKNTLRRATASSKKTKPKKINGRIFIKN